MGLILAFIAGYILGALAMFVYVAEKIGPATLRSYEIRRDDFARNDPVNHDI